MLLMLLGTSVHCLAQQKSQVGKSPARKPTATTTVKKSSTTAKPAEGAAKTFTLGNGTLGPLRIGQAVVSLPKSVTGLYDSYKYTKEDFEDEMDGDYTVELCHFYKAGREIFQAGVEEKKVVSFLLMKGSEFIKTSDGFYVGYNARKLFQKLSVEWETYFEGEVFATCKNFTYYLPYEDLIGVDYPTKIEHIKPNAVISRIVYK